MKYSEFLYKVNKAVARKAFNANRRIYLLPARCALDGVWVSPVSVIKGEEQEGSFNGILNSFSYYNSMFGKTIQFFLDNREDK